MIPYALTFKIPASAGSLMVAERHLRSDVRDYFKLGYADACGKVDVVNRTITLDFKSDVLADDKYADFIDARYRSLVEYVEVKTGGVIRAKYTVKQTPILNENDDGAKRLKTQLDLQMSIFRKEKELNELRCRLNSLETQQ